METEGRLRVADVFVGIRDPRQASKVEHDLVELLVIAVCGVLAGADDFVEIEEWSKERFDWFRRYLRLEHGIPSHDTFGRVFATIDAEAFGTAFRRWVSRIAPNLGKDEVVAIAGKTSRRSNQSALDKGGCHTAAPGQRLRKTLCVLANRRRVTP